MGEIKLTIADICKIAEQKGREHLQNCPVCRGEVGTLAGFDWIEPEDITNE